MEEIEEKNDKEKEQKEEQKIETTTKTNSISDTLPEEINLAQIKGFNKKKLKGMTGYEYAFTYLALVQLKKECDKTLIKQLFLPTKHDKEYIVKEFNFINKKDMRHTECFKLKKKIKNRLKLLFIDLDKENQKT